MKITPVDNVELHTNRDNNCLSKFTNVGTAKRKDITKTTQIGTVHRGCILLG